ncbi:MAG: DUF2605 domain-containing protein [Gloeocapsa sp. DLM2.Bin57]|nr:MAG: DUF2605 domain-containing protein [Gloeocapsa sp. DLM2.Bin57]
MSSSQPTENKLLKEILEPLLEDFQYWFSRSRSFLETEQITFLSAREQAELLERVKQSQQEVSTAQMLLKATNAQVGIEASMLVPWHQLVTECWQVAMKWRSLKNQ